MAIKPRPHPLARSPLVGRLNGWLESAWKRGLSPRPTLDPDALWNKAAKNAPATGELGGRSEVDAADFRLRLEVLAESLAAEARLNPLGLTIAHGLLVRTIRQRLELGALWADRPELAMSEIAAPIIVVGQMRSGTTRVHRLLAADPAHAATRFCDSWQPQPRSPDTRPLWSGLSLFIARQLDPWLDTIHPFGATRPDEELGWLACALDHCAYEAQWRVPTFTSFSESREPAPIYREFSRILRTDAATHGNAHLPRVLKVPQFAEDLPTLLAQFPNARVVMTSRDRADIASSAASLVGNQMTIQSDHADMDWIIAECARKIALREERMAAAIATFKGPLAVVDFEALASDWQGEMTRTYRLLGLEFSSTGQDAMQAEQGRAEKSPHHAHARLHRDIVKA